jgi:hypothetical protein
MDHHYIISFDEINDNILFIKFMNYYNKCIDGLLPDNIISIIFGEEFNQPVNNLPKYLKILKFCNNFNHPVDNLPNSITVLYFGNNFNQSIDNLPNSICIK